MGTDRIYQTTLATLCVGVPELEPGQLYWPLTEGGRSLCICVLRQTLGFSFCRFRPPHFSWHQLASLNLGSQLGPLADAVNRHPWHHTHHMTQLEGKQSATCHET